MQRGSGKVGPHEQAPGMLKLTGFLLRCASASECSLKHDSSSASFVSVLPDAAYSQLALYFHTVPLALDPCM